jgi:hypothetical protein
MTPERTLDRRRRPKSVADRLGRPERGWRLGLRRSGKPPLAGGKDLAHEPWRIPPLERPRQIGSTSSSVAAGSARRSSAVAVRRRTFGQFAEEVAA